VKGLENRRAVKGEKIGMSNGEKKRKMHTHRHTAAKASKLKTNEEKRCCCAIY